MPAKNELVLELKGVRPSNLPLARLAAYMREFASLIGDGAMLFSEIREGSTCVAARAAPGGSLSKARARIERARVGQGPREARSAYRNLCDMTATDGYPGRVREGATTVLHFPQRLNNRAHLRVHERGHITGELSGVLRDGEKGKVKARIRPMNGGTFIYCTANETIGKKMGAMFLLTVRVYGAGWWTRNEDGTWVCDSLHVDEVHRVENTDLRRAVDDLRRLDITWEDDPFADFEGAAFG